MGNVATGHLAAGSRFPDRRAAPRFAFDAELEMTDPVEQEQITGQVTVLSQKGCFGRTQKPLSQRGVVQARLRKDDAVFETWAWATPSSPEAETGVVLVFMDTAPEQAKVLAGWLAGLSSVDKPAKLPGSVR